MNIISALSLFFIAAAGYDANETKRDENAHAKLPLCCQSKRK